MNRDSRRTWYNEGRRKRKYGREIGGIRMIGIEEEEDRDQDRSRHHRDPQVDDAIASVEEAIRGGAITSAEVG
jgi:hypothetical protein